MKNIILFLIGLLLIFVEVFFTNFIFSGVSVNLLLIYIVFISLYIDMNDSMILGSLLGLLGDLLAGGIIGINACLFVGTAYLIANVEKTIFKDDRKIVCLLVVLTSAIFSIINALVAAIFFVSPPLLVGFIKAVLIIPILNGGVAYIAYTLFSDRLIKLRKE
ncbi:rod shape-determining protein MreD [Peptostreptococcus equinus]|uniref:Rod shape-determining protein MreD n=1 Tax=Peptostreptococcus equinus TaxID=3003601 RepID=A0ABY7JMG7_9FIRM|nr:rod shape-determining protein MreD [Peptostreptococcus sp. CBA3647]WAW14285.1 rod shape-determining protein MreD [Peptostreptococcus sp. CBA3647]